MRIAFITNSYPTPGIPQSGAFVQQLAWALARRGHAVEVLHPVNRLKGLRGPRSPRLVEEDTGSVRVTVRHLPYLSLPSRRLGPLHTGRWTYGLFRRRVGRAVDALEERPDLVYGHFLYPAGYAAVREGIRLGVPSVVAVGEDHFWSVAPVGMERAASDYRSATGLVAVSSLNRDRLIRDLGIPPEKILLSPNSVDLARFRPLPREEMARRHGIPLGKFTVAFVGAHEARKGPLRVLEAVAGLPDAQCLLIGQGLERIAHPRVVFKGPVPQDAVPELLACADLFVLPTTSEGSCNAVLEAMACGLPIITAVGPHMDDIVDGGVALRVDPLSVEALREAVRTLMNDPSRLTAMRRACLVRARDFDINRRAERLSAWFGSLIATHHRAAFAPPDAAANL